MGKRYYITRWWMTQGILVTEPRDPQDLDDQYVFWHGFCHRIGRRAFATLEEAKEAVKRDMPKRLRSVEKMRARLEQNYAHCMQMDEPAASAEAQSTGGR